jgi:hypothetical protein
MTPTPIALLEQAADCGLRLSFEPPEALTVEPARLCLAEFAGVLQAHKPALLALLKLPFVMVYSETLEETVFFCQDETARAVLVQAGAEEWSIHTRDELRILCEQNRIKPFTQAELRKLQDPWRKNCQMTFCAFINQSSRKDIGYAPLALQRCKRYPYRENAAKLPAVDANNSQMRAVPEVPRPDY